MAKKNAIYSMYALNRWQKYHTLLLGPAFGFLTSLSFGFSDLSGIDLGSVSLFLDLSFALLFSVSLPIIHNQY